MKRHFFKIFSKLAIGRLARRQLLWILAFSSLVTVISTAIQLFIEYRNDTEYIQEQFQQVKEAHLDSLTMSLWGFDAKQIETQLNSILSIRDIVAIEIIETNGTRYFKGQISPRHRTEKKRYNIVFRDKGRGETIGQLVVTASLEGVYARLKKRILVILFAQTCKTFFVSLFILYVINQLVMRHLETIADYTTRMQSATLGRRLKLERKGVVGTGEDELDKVVNGINMMGNRLRDDIVALQKTEHSLRDSEERYRTIFENAVEGFFQSTPEGRFLSVNPALATMLGYSSPEELIETITDIETQFYFHATDRQHYQQAVDSSGTIENFEFQAKRKDGTPLWLSNNTRCYFDAYGNVVRYEGTVTDIDKRRLAEQEREELQAQLISALKMESIGNLAGGIAHDFNNILAAILGYSDLSLMDIEKGSQLEKNIMAIRKAGERARDLIKQILTFARQAERDTQPVHVKSVAAEALDFIRSTTPLTITINPSLESESQVMGNATQLHQLFMNICTNSVQAMEQRGGILTVSMRDVKLSVSSHPGRFALPPGDYIVIVISDTGFGMRQELAERIFDPYFTTKEIGRGTGMGLAIVHGIVEAYGGKIQLETGENKGAKFTIYLPICNKDIDLPVVQKKVGVFPRGTEAILFIDDEEAIVTTSGRMLELLGYRVTQYTDSVSALRMFEASPYSFDIIISDMNMPEMSGDVLVGRIRAIRPEIPVIVCTGYSKRLTDSLIEEFAINACLYKPISNDDLAQAVRSVLDSNEHR